MDIGRGIRLAFEFYRAGRLKEAKTICSEILRVQPDNFDATGLLGAVHYEFREYPAAIACLEKASMINPSNANVYYNLGLALHDPATLDKAIFNYQKALKLAPDFADAHYYLGAAFKMQGRMQEAAEAFDNALYYDPHHIRALWARCMSRLLIGYPDEISIRTSRNLYQDELVSLRKIVSRGMQQDIEAIAEILGTQKPFYLAYQGLNDRELQEIYGDMVCTTMSLKYPQYSSMISLRMPVPEEPFRIGVVTGYFCDGSVWKIPTKGWFEHIDKNRFALYGYYTGKVYDEETEFARQHSVKFVEGASSFEDLCQIIRNDNLHVLIYSEIGMDSVSLRLSALRLAPIQCCSVIGHPQTSGFRTIDYYLSSDLMEPPYAADHYDSELIRLSNLSMVYSPTPVPIETINRDNFNLRPESILYLCCQSLFKYLPQYDEIYPRIARQVKACQFVFIEHEMSFVTEQVRRRIEQSFERYRIDPDDHIVFLPRLSTGQYRAINKLSDIFLDSIGWSGCNTTFEAIACNVPVVTLPGILMRGRHSFGILKMMDVTETIAASLDDYISLAVRLGNDPAWRRVISEKISLNKHRLYKDTTCIRALEEFLEAAVKKEHR